MEKGIKNADAVARKLEPASTRATNDRLEAVREERRKREEMIERRKAEAMTAKRRRARGEMSSSSKEEDESDTGDDTDPDQADDEYPLQLWEGMRWKLQVTKWGYLSIHQVKCEIHSSSIHFIMRATSECFNSNDNRTILT